MPVQRIRVASASRGQWTITVERTDDVVTSLYPSREAAIAAGTDLAKRDKIELLILGRDGRVRARKCFGDDLREEREVAVRSI
ncbi:DUF2188 domain-containing protein [Cupriavidus sp. D39]|uniref:DUF2188 domain-containing protein n=1 Tax=Cupriavidus sp. D39 TaxID=2997877 RepID=UPI00227187EA|nr:DUF2188 domain-containing protein [Cupriavidus sp. D39]MCY0853328.1 DUF2188 domain-containing protein [Cupriavidus sp. D39]